MSDDKRRERLIDVIRRLRAKATSESSTEAEAAAFAAKVQELLTAHGLSESVLVDAESAEEETVGRRSHHFRGSPARQVMLRAVCKFYLCTAVGPGRGGDPWIIVGRPTNVMVALDMFEYLLSTVIRMSNDYGRRTSGSNKIDWRRGCMLRLAERLDIMRRAEREKPQERRSNGNPGNLPALMADEQQIIKRVLRDMGVVTTKTRVRQGDDAAHGRAAADGIGLHRQIAGGSGRLAIRKG